MQQDLQYQGSSAAAAVKGAPAIAADEAASSDSTTQADSDSWRTDHAVNVRLTIPLPFVRCYLTIVGGKERREPNRRADDRRKHPLATSWNIAFLGLLGLITGLALFTVIQFAARYVLEQAGAV